MPDCMVKVFSCFPPCWFFNFNEEMAVLFSTLSNTTAAGVEDALAGLYEE